MIGLHEPAFDENDESRILQTLRSAWVSTGGPAVDEFEERFAEYVGARHAVSACSGTAALHLAILALRIREGVEGPFEVLMPTLTFIATANAVAHAGGIPRFVDTAPESMNCTAREFGAAWESGYVREKDGTWISRETGLRLLAIMPAHIMGWLADSEALSKLSADSGVALLEDAAESLGSRTLSGTHSGLAGLAGAFSFNGNKILTTGGGGMIVTNDEKLAKHMKHLSTTAKVDGLRFVHDEIGYNYRLVNILAALGCSQMEKLEGRLRRKTRIFELYSRYLDAEDVQVYRQDDCVPNHWLVNAVFREAAGRERALAALNEKGILARPLWTPVHLQPAYQTPDRTTGRFPNAEDVWSRTLSLPSSPQLSDEQVMDIALEVRRAAGA